MVLLTSLSLTNPGTGYSTAPTVTFSTPSSGINTATATATIGAGGTVTGLTIVSGGGGYDGPVTVTISNDDSIKLVYEQPQEQKFRKEILLLQ